MNKIEIIADYNGVRPAERPKKPETYIKLFIKGDLIKVDYKNGWPLAFKAIIEQIKNGQAAKLMLDSVGEYCEDEWEDGVPYIEPINERGR